MRDRKDLRRWQNWTIIRTKNSKQIWMERTLTYKRVGPSTYNACKELNKGFCYSLTAEIVLRGGPFPASFSFFLSKIYATKFLDFSRIRTRNVRVKGGHADHWTTTMAQEPYYQFLQPEAMAAWHICFTIVWSSWVRHWTQILEWKYENWKMKNWAQIFASVKRGRVRRWVFERQRERERERRVEDERE